MEDGEEVGEERGSSSWKCGAAGVERPREASKEKAAGITGKSVAVVVKNSSPPLAPSHGKRVGTGTGAHKTGDRGKIVFSHAVGGFLQDRLVCHMTESDKNIRCTYKTGNP